MSLFDDDFYSTRVSRRGRPKKDDPPFPRFSRRWSSLQMAFFSSFVSAIAVAIIFSLFIGIGDGREPRIQPALATAQMMDPYERPIQAAAKIRPAVVSIINEQMGFSFDSFGWFAEDEDELEEYSIEEGVLQQASLGSGVIFEKAGSKARIITNNHVVENAVSVKVVLVNGETRDATVIGKDHITDLAVLEIDSTGIEVVAEIGDSMALRDGETVIAIGNPLGLNDSLTMGIVSKTRRLLPVSLNQDGVYDWEQEVIQIDASINQGNSGGALIDLNGRLIGINSMKIADYGVEGIGFAIPMHNAMQVADSLIEYGRVKRPYIGVYTLDLEQYYSQQAFANATKGKDEKAKAEESALKLPEGLKRGVIVLEAVGPAKKSGLKFNDVIVKLDHQEIGSTMELRKYLYSKKAIGEKIEITYYRDSKLQSTSFVLAESTVDEE